MASRKDNGGSNGPPETHVTVKPDGGLRIEIFDEAPAATGAESEVHTARADRGVSLGDFLLAIGRDLGSEEVQAVEPAKAPRTGRKRRVRGDRPRARTIASTRLTQEEIRQGALLASLMDYQVPQTRGECKDGPRPCPFVRCRHHLYLDVNPATGSIKLNFPHLEVWELNETCAMDVADRGGTTLEEVGEILNLTRERVRQVEVRGLLKLKMSSTESFGLDAGLNAPRATTVRRVQERSDSPSARNSYQSEEFGRNAAAWSDKRERRIALAVYNGTPASEVAAAESVTRQAVYLVLQKIARWGGKEAVRAVAS